MFSGIIQVVGLVFLHEFLLHTQRFHFRVYLHSLIFLPYRVVQIFTHYTGYNFVHCMESWIVSAHMKMNHVRSPIGALATSSTIFMKFIHIPYSFCFELDKIMKTLDTHLYSAYKLMKTLDTHLDILFGYNVVFALAFLNKISKTKISLIDKEKVFF